jgi:predicted TIM-barrel fold metal-dependent hydrolase
MTPPATTPASVSRPYVDVHAHIGDTINRSPPVGQTVEKYLARMAQSSVYAAIPFPAAGGPLARGVLDTRDQNQTIAAACRSHPSRFPIGLAIVEVRHLQAGVDELERAMRDDGLLGFMVHPGISGHAMAEELFPTLEVVDARGGIAMLHIGGRGTEARAAVYARRFKNSTFLMAHVSMTREQHRLAVQHLARLDNAWYDFAQHPPDADPSWGIPDLVEQLGADRLLFGSDIPYYDYRILQGQIEAAPLPEDMKDGIAWRNAVDLIRRFKPEWQLDRTPVETPAAFADADLWAQQPGRPGRLC